MSVLLFIHFNTVWENFCQSAYFILYLLQQSSQWAYSYWRGVHLSTKSRYWGKFSRCKASKSPENFSSTSEQYKLSLNWRYMYITKIQAVTCRGCACACQPLMWNQKILRFSSSPGNWHNQTMNSLIVHERFFNNIFSTISQQFSKTYMYFQICF